jgi:hypothetical protein
LLERREQRLREIEHGIETPVLSPVVDVHPLLGDIVDALSRLAKQLFIPISSSAEIAFFRQSRQVECTRVTWGTL